MAIPKPQEECGTTRRKNLLQQLRCVSIIASSIRSRSRGKESHPTPCEPEPSMSGPTDRLHRAYVVTSTTTPGGHVLVFVSPPMACVALTSDKVACCSSQVARPWTRAITTFAWCSSVRLFIRKASLPWIPSQKKRRARHENERASEREAARCVLGLE